MESTDGEAVEPASIELSEGKTSWVKALALLNVRDLLSVSNHTDDFSGSRAGHIHTRIQALALIYALVGVLWIGIDYLTVPPQHFAKLSAIRLAISAAFFILATWNLAPHRLAFARARLLALVLLPTLFFVTSRLVLADGHADAAMMVYNFYPFVIVAQLAVFPLTLLEGLLLAIPAAVGILVVESLVGQLVGLQVIGSFSLLTLLTALALWAEMSQLHMLLSLYRQATRDPLTGLYNRRLVMDRLEEEIRRARRYGGKVSVMLLDLDKFKRVNDTFGHLVGDMVLRRFASVATASIRNVDFIGRYGGEEFLVILPETGIAGASDVAERIRKACHPVPVRTQEGQLVPFTASIGVAEMAGEQSASDLLECADVALYRAKEAGRDRVVRAR